MAASVSFLQQAENTTAQTTYTFSSQSLGAADAGRYIVVCIAARAGGETDGAVSALTIGGVSATITAQIPNNGGANTNLSAIAIAAVPTGTTGDIVVTLNFNHLRCSVAAYRVLGIDGVTAFDSATSTDTDPTASLDIPAGGIAIAGSISAAADSATWTGLTENFDDNFQAFATHSGASAAFEDEQTDLTITCNWSTSSVPAGVFASWAAAVSGRTLASSRTLATGRTLASGRTLATRTLV